MRELGVCVKKIVKRYSSLTQLDISVPVFISPIFEITMVIDQNVTLAFSC